MAGRLPRFIGPYEVDRQIGTGGMGTVLLGKHRLLARLAAIKVRRREKGGGEEVLAERFRQGAILQSELDHPHVARVLDYLESPLYQAIVMEYLPGGTIEDALHELDGPMAVESAVAIGIHAADGMAYAHRLGVIHRDIKPANIMLKEAGDPMSTRITDFGVAKALERSPDLTVAGANVGTLWYMPPEQFNHESPTPLMDVYALGASIYEMLTGQIPFDAPDTSEIFRRFLDKVPPPSIRGRNPEVPRGIAAVVEMCLALDPAARVPSAAVLALLLRAVAEREAMAAEDAVARRLLTQAGDAELAQIRTLMRHPAAAEVVDALDTLCDRVNGGTTRVELGPAPLSGPPTPVVEDLFGGGLQAAARPRFEVDEDEDSTMVMDLPLLDDE